MSFAADHASEQLARAKRVAIELAGHRANRQIVLSMLALVKSVEGDGTPPEPVKKPVESRKVLTRNQPVKPAAKAQRKPTQEGLW